LKVLAFLVVGFAMSAQAQEIVALQTRPGVTQAFFIAGMGEHKPEAAAMLLIGGGGNIRLRTEAGEIRFSQGNFLPRARREFIRNGILPVILDNPTDQQAGEGMSDGFRESREHYTDIRAVRGELDRRYPGLPVFLVGTSRSTLSVAYLARWLQTDIQGAVLTSSLFYSGSGRNPRPVLAGFNWAQIKAPLLFVHHEDDACGATPYREAARVTRYPLVALITVRGGKPPESGPCDPRSSHGFFGKEAETVDAIAAWMFGKPFAKEIR
jgi:hypothetical protein